ncbi:MAG: sulfite exporter TauE/SafE family protein [Anaerolineae bacterium]|nr:sulfite exporter TauE/SafE family protein [Anaerolineae bacterium]
MSLQFWFMFPVSILVATTAMASGVEGATFFAPIFILLLGLPPEVAIGTGLITEVFGFASGLYAYRRKRLIDYKLGTALLVVTIPMALLGTWLSGIIDPNLLKIALGIGLLAIGANFLRTPAHEEVQRLDQQAQTLDSPDTMRCIVTASGEEICYQVCNRTEGRLIAGIGSLFMGMVSTGLGEMNGFYLLRRCRVPARVAVATSVFVVAITALVASTGHFVRFVQSGGDSITIVLSLVIFTAPGVIIGGQIGSMVASRISQQMLERALGVLFILVALLMLADALL